VGAFSKVTADVRKLAQPYGAPAVAELARLAGIGDGPGAANEATRVAALRELLDRAYGRSTQLIGGDEERVHISFEWAPAQQSAASTVIEDEPSSAPLTLVWESSH
jgi:hypothetical protein